jgi:TPR repeat protein
VPPISPTPAQYQLDREEITAVPPISPTPAQYQLDREEITAVPPISPKPAQRQLDQEEITVLLKRGKDLIANGDLAAARLVLQRAADANDAEAALALGATYDPFVLRELKVYGFTADATVARTWYEKARGFGSAAASRRLEMLTIGAR